MEQVQIWDFRYEMPCMPKTTKWMCLTRRDFYFEIKMYRYHIGWCFEFWRCKGQVMVNVVILTVLDGDCVTSLWVLNKNQTLNFHFSGGSDYVQLFSGQELIAVVKQSITLTSSRSPLLVDEDFTTCILHISFALQSSTWAKVIPNELYIKRENFSTYLFGKGFTCSPIGGFSVARTAIIMPKYSLSRHKCEYRCTYRLFWEFVVLYLRPLVIYHGGSPPELCEIRLSIWQYLYIMAKGYRQKIVSE